MQNIRLESKLIALFILPLAALNMAFAAPDTVKPVPFHVVLDPGHGGSDHGAVVKDFKESEITLVVAKLVQKELEKDARFKVSMTRDNDRFLSLEKRAEIANQQGDAFISIHVNSSTDPHARGQEIYFQNQLPADEEGLFLASRENDGKKSDLRLVPPTVQFLFEKRENLSAEVKAIIEDLARKQRLELSAQFAKELYYEWNGDKYKKSQPIRQAPFYVISNVTKPAVLIEMGYLTNKNEANKLLNPEYQKKIASGIYKSLVRFKEFVDKGEATGLN